jgi:hypothetical protein
MPDTMSVLSHAMAALSHPTHERCGAELNKGKEKMRRDHAIDSGDHTSTNTDSEDYNQDSNDHSRGDDEKGNHRHTPHTTNEHGIVFEKWTSSQACTTSDAQSKVYNTERKESGGTDDAMLAKQRMQQV